MKVYNFNSEDFAATIKDAIQNELKAVEKIMSKRKAISLKIEDNALELTKLEQEKKQIFNIDDLLSESLESYKVRRDQFAILENKIQAAIIFGEDLAKAEKSSNHELAIARYTLIKKFNSAVDPYIIKARMSMAEIIENILVEDQECRESLLTLHGQICQDAGIVDWSFSFVSSDLYPLPSRKASLWTMVQDCKDAYKNLSA